MPHLGQTRVLFCDRTIVVKAGEDVNVVHNDGSLSVGTVGSLETRGDLQPYLLAAAEFELWAKLPPWAAAARGSALGAGSSGVEGSFWDGDAPSPKVLTVLQDSLTCVALMDVYRAGAALVVREEQGAARGSGGVSSRGVLGAGVVGRMASPAPFSSHRHPTGYPH
jgi:hypothetical protein